MQRQKRDDKTLYAKTPIHVWGEFGGRINWTQTVLQLHWQFKNKESWQPSPLRAWIQQLLNSNDQHKILWEYIKTYGKWQRQTLLILTVSVKNKMGFMPPLFSLFVSSIHAVFAPIPPRVTMHRLTTKDQLRKGWQTNQGHSHKLPWWEVDEMVIRYSETSFTHKLRHISISHSWRQNTLERGKEHVGHMV